MGQSQVFAIMGWWIKGIGMPRQLRIKHLGACRTGRTK